MDRDEVEVPVLDENEEYFRPKESCASTSLSEDHFKNSYSVTISNIAG